MISTQEFQTLFQVSARLSERLVESGTLQRYSAGDVVVSQATMAEHIGFVIDGMVASVRDNYDGVERYSAFITQGLIFGESSFIVPRKSFATFRAMCDCIVLLVSYEQIRQLMAESSEITEHLMVSQAKKLQYASIIHFTAKERDKLVKVATTVDAIAEFSRLDTLPISIEQLSSMLGMSRNTVSQCLKQLDEKGAIKLDKLNITIIDRELLSVGKNKTKLF
ncbi:Crp/Fnr family transcriptional regulator [Vibrio sp. WXL103]|uniref:Crp/Fnr family transcriptional regulator n=1 Tax=unclassified Vibrio TaxID=2614977 RepID=UPI003EC68530